MEPSQSTKKKFQRLSFCGALETLILFIIHMRLMGYNAIFQF